MSQVLTYSTNGPPQMDERPERAGRGMLSASASRIRNMWRAMRIGPMKAGDARQAAELAAALRTVEILRKRVDLSDARIKELEGRLTTFEIDTLELRSRLICLHGKLATTAATARYQTMTLDLERGHAAGGGGG